MTQSAAVRGLREWIDCGRALRAEDVPQRACPTPVQRGVLTDLENGGHIEQSAGEAVLVTIEGRIDLNARTFAAMQDFGWLWQSAPNVWRITTAGRKVLASGSVR
jgi:hypothetical protein